MFLLRFKIMIENPYSPYKSAVEELVDLARMAYGAVLIGYPQKQFELILKHAQKIRRLTLKALIVLGNEKKKNKPRPKPKPGGGYGRIVNAETA